MGPKRVSLNSRASEFNDDFIKDENQLMCRFCHHSVCYKVQSVIATHLESKGHKQKKAAAEHVNIQTQQLTLPTAIQAAESRKNIVMSFVKTLVEANIPLEKANKLQPWIRKNVCEGGSISAANILRREYLPITSDSCTCSVINILFSYHGITKLIEVGFLDQVNNRTIDELIIQILVKWSIPFEYPCLIASDSAAYMKKYHHEVLKPLLPQLIHMLEHYLAKLSKYLF
ncbi:724_t:CDS:2 [Cetraspora pellucida]|uniref:724_t:CDS:1 n=1 Tax=Cetraspora pellucida TaxID=1433469 RepID=A0A9N9GJ77_9GLOM|nr:724_t:CDS:2 [Cetraspora pellucida]